MKTAIAALALAVYGFAQAPAAPTFKNGEQPLAVAANDEKDPKAKLEKLDKWKHDFPETDYAQQRLGMYFETYGQLKMYHEQVMAAQELRKSLPDNLQVLRVIFGDVQQIKPPAPDDIAAVEDAAKYVLDHTDQVFDPSKGAKGSGFSDDQLKSMKPVMVEYAKGQLDWAAEQKGMDAVIARLKEDPTRTALNMWLAAQYREKAKADATNLVQVLFHYARVAAYDGPGAQPANIRSQYKTSFDRQYNGYHGDMTDADKVLAAAKSSPLPDPGFTIVSITDISKAKIAATEAARSANPGLAFWTDTKTALTGADGQATFDSGVKDAELPGTAVPGGKFKGKIVSMTPAMRPKKILLAIEKDGVADCTLELETPLPGNMKPGEELEFSGVAKSFTKDPYMLVLTTDKDKITGWTGKNPAAPRPGTKKPASK